MNEKLVTAIADMNEDDALQMVHTLLDAGEDPQAILDAATEAMAIVGQRYDEKEYYLPELIIAGDMMKAIGELVKPKLRAKAGSAKGARHGGHRHGCRRYPRHRQRCRHPSCST